MRKTLILFVSLVCIVITTLLLLGYYGIFATKDFCPKPYESEELIIAVCTENVNWIEACAKKYKKVTVYNKCGRTLSFRSRNIEVNYIANIGSCDYSFLTYIIDRYDDLPNFMEFTKGSQPPNGKYVDCLLCEEYGGSWDHTFSLFDYPYAHHKGPAFEGQPWFASGYDNIREWVRAQDFLSESLYERSFCNIIYGGHFGATAEQIRRTPREDWQKLREQQQHPREEIDHFIERTWRVLLCRPPHSLVIVAEFNNQANDLQEWLQHYTRQGVARFYLIDKGSTDQWRKAIIGFPVTMVSTIDKATSLVRKEAEWVLVVDVDDFLYARNEYATIKDYLASLPKDINRISVLSKQITCSVPARRSQSCTSRITATGIIRSICQTHNLLRLDPHISEHKNASTSILYTDGETRDWPLHLNRYVRVDDDILLQDTELSQQQKSREKFFF